MDPQTELTKLYSSYSTQAIEASDGRLLLDAFGVAQPEELVAIQGYSEAFVLVSGCSSILDSLVEKHVSDVEQVRESLRLLRRMLDDGEPEKKIKTMLA